MPELVAKDFFQRQEEARTASFRLIPLFLLAAAAVIGSVYLVYSLCALFVAGFFRFWRGALAEEDSRVFHFWDWERLLWTALVVLVLFLVISVWKTLQLREGGRAVARLLGAQRVSPGATDPDKRRLLNVVEEMSVASGIPVPDVYLLEREPSINAFVAGHAVDDMIVGVTGGAVKYLTRDELQGVIAHEYSHIFNGDMALKMRLMGWVHGLFGVTILAEWLMDRRNAQFERQMSADGKPTFNGVQVAADLALLVIGFALSFIGWHGAVFGRIIKASVCRQREHLADAAAVQFTRYPEGLAGALEKVRQWPDGGQVVCPHAEEASHMFFADALQEERYVLLMSTHPPVAERLARIQNMMGRSAPRAEVQGKDSVDDASVTQPVGKTPAPGRKEGQPAMPVVQPEKIVAATGGGVAVERSIAQVGLPVTEHLAFATKLLNEQPESLKEAMRDKLRAQWLICGLLLSSAPTVRQVQAEIITRHLGEAAAEAAKGYDEETRKLPPQARVPLVELSLPGLREMTPAEYRQFDQCLQELVACDQELDVFEFALQHILRRHLGGKYQLRLKPELRYFSVQAVAGDVSVLLTLLASAGQEGDDVRAAFAAGVKSFNSTQLNLRWLGNGQCTLATLQAALENLAETGPSVKRAVLQACAATVAADGLIQAAEGELLRAIADALDCPMPPLVK